MELAADLVRLKVDAIFTSGTKASRILQEAVKDTPILMLTAKGRDTDIAKGMAMGATVYLTKPFSTREMAPKVRELLGQAA